MPQRRANPPAGPTLPNIVLDAVRTQILGIEGIQINLLVIGKKNIDALQSPSRRAWPSCRMFPTCRYLGSMSGKDNSMLTLGLSIFVSYHDRKDGLGHRHYQLVTISIILDLRHGCTRTMPVSKAGGVANLQSENNQRKCLRSGSECTQSPVP